jgi:site-specific DNA-methyltransferase (adenine-specific)
MSYRILGGDCVARMGMLNPESIDNIITDPPYEIGFMGKGWDSSGVAYNPVTWKAAHRVLKPNGIMLVFGATRTHHRIAHAIERAGFEIIDIVAWTYGTGFPKSHNISKAIDKNAGAKRKVIGQNKNHRSMKHTNSMVGEPHSGDGSITASSTPDAKQWEGWGTALKPAWEPVLIARKKGSSRTVENYSQFHYISKASKKEKNAGLSGFEDKLSKTAYGNRVCSLCNKHELQTNLERRCVCENPVWGDGRLKPTKNTHPTVKPIKLMKALIEEFTEEGSIVFDPFTGSGSTGIASVLLNREFIGCELTPEYIPLAKARIEYAINDGELFE